MATEYDRPGRRDDAEPCAFTSYDAGAPVAYEETDAVEGDVPATGAGAEGLERRVWQALYAVQDPEMPISIVDLGLIYGVDVDATAGTADVRMTLTYTGCPARDMLVGEVTRAVEDVAGVDEATITLVWSPDWTVDMVTEEGEAALRDFGLSI